MTLKPHFITAAVDGLGIAFAAEAIIALRKKQASGDAVGTLVGA
jgi:hypothetical protein